MSSIINKTALLTIALTSTKLFAQSDKPNVILIMTDQQSYNTISAHSDLYKGVYSTTPNIDRLVKSGVSFTRTYCANPVSVPSRFSLFTGMYGGQFGIRDNKTQEAVESEVRPLLDSNGMGSLFSKGGYDTYYGGKVHLPFSGRSGSSKFLAPSGYGFENYYTHDERELLGLESAKLIDKKAQELSNGTLDKPFLMVASFINPHDICLESSTNLSSVVEDKGGKKQPITDCVREMRRRVEAIDSVDFYANHAPSLPLNFEKTKGYPQMRKSPNRDFPDYYWRKYRWIYGELVSMVDSHIGDILDALDRNPELKKNTIIVFTSDHGEMQGSHKTVTKNLPYDECQRVPLIFSGAGIKKGIRDNSLVCNGVDLLPTICSLANIEIPQSDGLSLASRVKGKDRSSLRDTLYIEGDGFLNVITDNHKYTLFDGNNESEMLIDLSNDKGEMLNIANSRRAISSDLKSFIDMDKLKPSQKKIKGEGNKAKVKRDK